MKKSLRRIISSVLAIVLTVSVIPVPVYADETDEEVVVTETESFVFESGYAPSPNEHKFESVNEGRSGDELLEDYPAKYVSPEASKIPSRYQGTFGTCWAFSSMAAAEMSALKHGVRLRNGKIADNSIDLSELHLAYFFGKTNEPYDPLGGFKGDMNSVPDDNFLHHGSNPILTAQLLANWIGAADEKDYPYGYDDSFEKWETAHENATDDVLHLKGYYTANPRTEEDRPAVKKLITEYGAAATGMYALAKNETGFDEAYSKEHNSYYLPTDKGVNHIVAIVGWDDDFPKENFASSQKPEGDGAWLIRNTWQAGNYVASDGQLIGNKPELNSYFWMSYYDKTFLDYCAAYDMDSVDRYAHSYQYDGSMVTDDMSNVEKYANIFTTSSDGPQELSSVYFLTFSANIDYKIDVYTGVSEGQPESGTRAMSTQEGRTTYSGAYTIELTDPVALEPGQSFSVVITFPKDKKIGVEESFSNENFVTTAHTEGRRSLCLDGDTWKTANEAAGVDKYGDFCIKAFTTWSSPVTGISLPEKKTIKKDDSDQLKPVIKPLCAGDKSVTWKSSDDSVVTVDGDGKIKGVKTGSADITATTNDGGFTATCHVTVTDYGEVTLLPGEVRRMSVAAGRYVYGLKWFVENADPKNCVSVKNGVVTAGNIPKGKTGTADVKFVFGPATYTYKITVDGTVHDNVPITEGKKKTAITAPKTLNLNVGTNGKVVVSVPENLRNRSREISYDIGTSGILSIGKPSYNNNGSKVTFEIKPSDAGAAYIEWSIADANGNETKAYTKVVIKKPITDLRLNKVDKLTVGKGVLLNVTGTVGNTDPKDLTFSVKGKGIKVTKYGYIIATEPGAKGTVTVKSGKVSASIDVTANTPEKYLVLKQTSVTVAIPKPGAKAKTTAISIAVPGKGQDQPNVNWRIDPEVPGVTVNENGIVSVSSEAKLGHYEVVATPSDEKGGYNTATCELIVK